MKTGVDEPGLDILARVGFDTLGLQTYLTAGPKDPAPGRSARDRPRPRPRASSTPTSSVASSRPRSSRTTTWWPPARCQAAKAAGKVRMEGKDYVMTDGDVVEFRFNV